MAKDKKASKTDKSSKNKNQRQGFQYDESKDVVVKDYGIIDVGGGRSGNFSVRLMQYNGGEIKLAIARTGINKETEEQWFSPRLGRISMKEAEALMPIVEKAMKAMTKRQDKKKDKDGDE